MGAKKKPAQKAEEEEIRLNVTLPASIHSQVKARAAERRQTLREYILDVLATQGVK